MVKRKQGPWDLADECRATIHNRDDHGKDRGNASGGDKPFRLDASGDDADTDDDIVPITARSIFFTRCSAVRRPLSALELRLVPAPAAKAASPDGTGARQVGPWSAGVRNCGDATQQPAATASAAAPQPAAAATASAAAPPLRHARRFSCSAVPPRCEDGIDDWAPTPPQLVQRPKVLRNAEDLNHDSCGAPRVASLCAAPQAPKLSQRRSERQANAAGSRGRSPQPAVGGEGWFETPPNPDRGGGERGREITSRAAKPPKPSWDRDGGNSSLVADFRLYVCDFPETDEAFTSSTEKTQPPNCVANPDCAAPARLRLPPDQALLPSTNLGQASPNRDEAFTSSADETQPPECTHDPDRLGSARFRQVPDQVSVRVTVPAEDKSRDPNRAEALWEPNVSRKLLLTPDDSELHVQPIAEKARGHVDDMHDASQVAARGRHKPILLDSSSHPHDDVVYPMNLDPTKELTPNERKPPSPPRSRTVASPIIFMRDTDSTPPPASPTKKFALFSRETGDDAVQRKRDFGTHFVERRSGVVQVGGSGQLEPEIQHLLRNGVGDQGVTSPVDHVAACMSQDRMAYGTLQPESSFQHSASPLRRSGRSERTPGEIVEGTLPEDSLKCDVSRFCRPELKSGEFVEGTIPEDSLQRGIGAEGTSGGGSGDEGIDATEDAMSCDKGFNAGALRCSPTGLFVPENTQAVCHREHLHNANSDCSEDIVEGTLPLHQAPEINEPEEPCSAENSVVDGTPIPHQSTDVCASPPRCDEFCDSKTLRPAGPIPTLPLDNAGLVIADEYTCSSDGGYGDDRTLGKIFTAASHGHVYGTPPLARSVENDPLVKDHTPDVRVARHSFKSRVRCGDADFLPRDLSHTWKSIGNKLGTVESRSSGPRQRTVSLDFELTTDDDEECEASRMGPDYDYCAATLTPDAPSDYMRQDGELQRSARVFIGHAEVQQLLRQPVLPESETPGKDAGSDFRIAGVESCRHMARSLMDSASSAAPDCVLESESEGSNLARCVSRSNHAGAMRASDDIETFDGTCDPLDDCKVSSVVLRSINEEPILSVEEVAKSHGKNDPATATTGCAPPADDHGVLASSPSLPTDPQACSGNTPVKFSRGAKSKSVACASKTNHRTHVLNCLPSPNAASDGKEKMVTPLFHVIAEQADQSYLKSVRPRQRSNVEAPLLDAVPESGHERADHPIVSGSFRPEGASVPGENAEGTTHAMSLDRLAHHSPLKASTIRENEVPFPQKFFCPDVEANVCEIGGKDVVKSAHHHVCSTQDRNMNTLPSRLPRDDESDKGPLMLDDRQESRPLDASGLLNVPLFTTGRGKPVPLGEAAMLRLKKSTGEENIDLHTSSNLLDFAAAMPLFTNGKGTRLAIHSNVSKARKTCHLSTPSPCTVAGGSPSKLSPGPLFTTGRGMPIRVNNSALPLPPRVNDTPSERFITPTAVRREIPFRSPHPLRGLGMSSVGRPSRPICFESPAELVGVDRSKPADEVDTKNYRTPRTSRHPLVAMPLNVVLNGHSGSISKQRNKGKEFKCPRRVAPTPVAKPNQLQSPQLPEISCPLLASDGSLLSRSKGALERTRRSGMIWHQPSRLRFTISGIEWLYDLAWSDEGLMACMTYRFPCHTFGSIAAFPDDLQSLLKTAVPTWNAENATFGAEDCINWFGSMFQNVHDKPATRLGSVAWTKMAYALAVWKYARLALGITQAGQHELGLRFFTAAHVIRDLVRRVSKEWIRNQHSPLLKMFRRDASAFAHVVLVVTSVQCFEQRPAKLEVSDGWYIGRATLDPALSLLVKEKCYLGVGDKVHVSHATIAPCGPDPFFFGDGDELGSSLLRLCVNGVRKVKNSHFPLAKLGFQRKTTLHTRSLRNILPFGGAVPCVIVVVERSYPLCFMETIAIRPDQDAEYSARTDKIWRRQEAEDDAAQRHIELFCQGAEIRESKRGAPEAEIEATRNVSSLLQFKAIGLADHAPSRASCALIDVWNPTEEVVRLIQEEGRVLLLHSVRPGRKKDHLSVSSSCVRAAGLAWMPMVRMTSAPRRLTTTGHLFNGDIKHGDDFDGVFVVIHVGALQGNVRHVFLVDFMHTIQVIALTLQGEDAKCVPRALLQNVRAEFRSKEPVYAIVALKDVTFRGVDKVTGIADAAASMRTTFLSMRALERGLRSKTSSRFATTMLDAAKTLDVQIGERGMSTQLDCVRESIIAVINGEKQSIRAWYSETQEVNS